MTSNEIFILEDDLTMRAMLKASLERAGYQVVFFADGDALLAHARQASPACVLLDLCLPGKSGIEVLTTLNSQGCSAPVLMISGQGNIPTAVQALRLGAADFIEKPFRPGDLLARIEAAGASAEARPASPAEHFKNARGLSRREQEVLDHLLAGSTNKLIARKLNVSPRTIEDHRANIMRKAGVRTTAQLAIAVFEAKPRRATSRPLSRDGGAWQALSA